MIARAILIGLLLSVIARADSPTTSSLPSTKETAGLSSTQTSVEGAKTLFPDATPSVVTAVTQKIFPAVVRLDVAQEIYSEGKRNLRRGIGSGVIISDEGHILTNYHVAGRAAEIYVTLQNKERVHAKLIGDDHWTDLAVVQLDMDEVKRKHCDFQPAQLGESNTLQPCENVMAVGTPFGLARTVTFDIAATT